ncbi:MAG: phage terminase small subunit P27 family [Candidatus Obscuribacter sp.]|nr:phage terminase small subunit P27 family [Candidatus Obscuribacter sp.]
MPPSDAIPPPPPHFDKRHVAKWNETADKVLKARILHDLDTDFLQSYVENWFLAADAMKDIQQRGAVIWIENENGSRPIRNPNHLAYMEAIKIVKAIGEKFGFSPRDRQAVKVTEKAPVKSTILEAMNGGKKKAI